MNPLANLAALLGIKPRHPKHRRYARWWKGVMEAKRKARRERLDNWTRALQRGFAAKALMRPRFGPARNKAKQERNAR